MALQANGKKPQEAGFQRLLLRCSQDLSALEPSCPRLRSLISCGKDDTRCITIHYPPDTSARWDLPTATPALAQVNKQIRLEALPRLHMIAGLYMVGPKTLNRLPSMKWLAVFGPTRVPMTRSFVVFAGRRLEILLPGAPDFPKEEKRSVLVRGTGKTGECQPSQDEIEKVKVFIEPRLKRDCAGLFSEVEDVPAIVGKVTEIARAAVNDRRKFLKWRNCESERYASGNLRA